jgi:hypothetical protein
MNSDGPTAVGRVYAAVGDRLGVVTHRALEDQALVTSRA